MVNKNERIDDLEKEVLGSQGSLRDLKLNFWAFVFIFLILFFIYNFYIDYRIEDLEQSQPQENKIIIDNYSFNSTEFVNDSIFYGDFLGIQTTAIIPDYSKEGYYQIYTDATNGTFVYLECKNSTLKLINNSIRCVKRGL